MFLLENANIAPMIVWIAIFIIALVIEILTTELVSIWFSLGAIPSVFMAAFDVDLKYQILVYAIVSAVLFCLSKFLIKRKLKMRDSATNADSLLGTEILVLKSCDSQQNGEGKVRDVVWTVKSKSKINEGEYAIIKEIKGNTLIIEKKGE